MNQYGKYIISALLALLLSVETFAQVAGVPTTAPTAAPTPSPNNPTTTNDNENPTGNPLEELIRRRAIREHKAKLKALEEARPEPSTPVIAKPKRKPKPRIVILPPLPQPPLLRSFGRLALLQAEYKPQSIVALIPTDTTENAETLAKSLGLTLIKQSPLSVISGLLVEFGVPENQNVEDTTRALLADTRFEGAHPNYIFQVQQNAELPVSPLKDLQYAPNHMDIAEAHQLSTGKGITIAVIDTGVDLAHGELNAQNFRNFDAVGNADAAGELHGTAMAGVIAASGNMVGIAPGANMLAVRAFAEADDGRFLSDSYTIAKAIDWAVVNGADILNMSFAGPADPLLLKLMDELSRRKLLMVAAAGNQGKGAPAAYPAAHRGTIAVTATDDKDALYQNANRGSYVTFAAPGVDVIAPAPGNGYELSSGTSIATAHVSGVIALMLSGHRELQPEQIVQMLGKSAKDFGAPGLDPEFGFGLVDAYKAIQHASAGN